MEKEVIMKKPNQQDFIKLLGGLFKNTGIDVKNTPDEKDIQKALKIMQNSPALKSMMQRAGINVNKR